MTAPSRPSPTQLERARGIIRARTEAIRRGEDVGPWVMRCVCDDPVDDHRGTGNRGKCTSCTRCIRYRPNVIDRYVQSALEGAVTPFTANLARRREAEYAARPRVVRGPNEWSVRASDLDGCVKALWYRNVPPEDYTPVPKGNGAALAGTVIEAAIAEINRVEYPWREYQREVTIKGVSSPGRIDEWDSLLGRVVEIKSCGERRWEQIQTWGPVRKHKGQAFLYADALERSGEWVSEVVLHYIHRDNLEEETYVFPWDDEARAFTEECRDTLIGYQTTLDIAAMTGEPPERDGRSTGDPLCMFCEAQRHCWGVEAAEAQGRSPESLTILGTLDAKKIAWACQRIVEARERKKAAEAEYDAVNALIDHTVVPDEYEGIGKVERGRGGSILQAELARVYYETAMQRGVDLSDVPIPRSGPGKPVAKLVPLKRRQAALEAAQADEAQTAGEAT